MFHAAPIQLLPVVYISCPHPAILRKPCRQNGAPLHHTFFFNSGLWSVKLMLYLGNKLMAALSFLVPWVAVLIGFDSVSRCRSGAQSPIATSESRSKATSSLLRCGAAVQLTMARRRQDIAFEA